MKVVSMINLPVLKYVHGKVGPEYIDSQGTTSTYHDIMKMLVHELE